MHNQTSGESPRTLRSTSAAGLLFFGIGRGVWRGAAARLAVVLLFVLAACGSPTAAPTTTPAATPLNLPTLEAVGATVLPSDLGRNPSNPAATPHLPAPTIVSIDSTPDAPSTVPYDYALRPEYAQDFNLVNNKTVYIIRWQVSDDLAEIRGTQRTVFANRTGQPLNQVYFRLFPNLPDSDAQIEIEAVRASRRPITFQRDAQGTALRVPFARPIQPNAVVPIAIDYRITIPAESKLRYGDFTRTSWIATLPTIYPIIPAYDAQGWHLEIPPPYGDLVYADSSIYDVSITTASQYNVIASGELVSETTEGDRVTRRFIGAPMRDFDANITAALVKSSARVGDVTLNSWFLPAHAAGGKQVLDWVVNAFSVYEQRFGPYPFKELDIVEAPTTAGGIEYPGLFTLNTRLYDDPAQRGFFEFAAAHETAHQWFYSTVGNDQVNHPWLDEALAQFATVVYMEDRYGKAQADRIREQFFVAPYEAAKTKWGDMPAGLPVSGYNEEQYGVFVYEKGMFFFDEVRRLLGDAEFFAAMRRYYDQFKFKIAAPQDLVDEFNRHGSNVTPLYLKWIVGS